MWSVGNWCLLWQQPKKTMLKESHEAEGGLSFLVISWRRTWSITVRFQACIIYNYLVFILLLVSLMTVWHPSHKLSLLCLSDYLHLSWYQLIYLSWIVLYWFHRNIKHFFWFCVKCILSCCSIQLIPPVITIMNHKKLLKLFLEFKKGWMRCAKWPWWGKIVLEVLPKSGQFNKWV